MPTPDLPVGAILHLLLSRVGPGIDPMRDVEEEQRQLMAARRWIRDRKAILVSSAMDLPGRNQMIALLDALQELIGE